MNTKGPKPPGSGNYEVGYGRPPVHTRFRKGQSGNPRGSVPKRTPLERAKQVMLQEAYPPVTVREGERTMRMPAIAAIFRSQLASGLKGNGAAQRASLRMIKAIEADIATADNQFFKVMVDYKINAEIEIERRRKLGTDDILFDLETGDVYVKGGLNSKDSRMLRKLGLKR